MRECATELRRNLCGDVASTVSAVLRCKMGAVLLIAACAGAGTSVGREGGQERDRREERHALALAAPRTDAPSLCLV